MKQDTIETLKDLIYALKHRNSVIITDQDVPIFINALDEAIQALTFDLLDDN